MSSTTRELRYSVPGGDTIVAGQPFFSARPGLRMRWADEHADHLLLNDLLGQVFVLELDHVVKAAAGGQDYEVAPLHELAERPGWLLQSRLKDAPDRYRLTRADTGQQVEGARSDLLLTLELAARTALGSVDGQSSSPSWVGRLRYAHQALRHALNGQDLFQLA